MTKRKEWASAELPKAGEYPMTTEKTKKPTETPRVALGLSAARKKQGEEAEARMRDLRKAIEEGSEMPVLHDLPKPRSAKEQKKEVERPKVMIAPEAKAKPDLNKEQLENTKNVLGQERAARIWDEVMPMLWERKGTVGSKEDIEAQHAAAKKATDYVVRYAAIESEFKEEMTGKEAKAAVKKLNAEFASSGLPGSYHPAFGTTGETIKREKAKPAKAEGKKSQVAKAEGTEQQAAAEPVATESVIETPAEEMGTLEERLEKKYGHDPADQYFGLKRIDMDVKRRMASDPDYKQWVAELKASKKEAELKEAAAARLEKRKTFVSEEQEPAALHEGATKLVKAIVREDELEEQKFFEGGERLERDTARVQEAIGTDKELTRMQQRLQMLEAERDRLTRGGHSVKQINAEIAQTEQRMIARQESLPEAEPAEVTEGFRAKGAEREQLVKLDQELHDEVAKLMGQKRTPEIIKELDEKSSRIKETEARLHELAKDFGEVPLPKIPLMARVKGFFRDLFAPSASAKREEAPRSEQPMEVREEDLIPESERGPSVNVAEELAGMNISPETMKVVPNAQELYMIALHQTEMESSANNFVEEAAKYIRASNAGIETYMKPFVHLAQGLGLESDEEVKKIIELGSKALDKKRQIEEGARATEEARRRSRTREPIKGKSAADILSRKKPTSERPPMDQAA